MKSARNQQPAPRISMPDIVRRFENRTGHTPAPVLIEGWALPSARLSIGGFVIAAVVFSVVFIANCWIGDDAFISFRVSDNLINGYGPRWNVAERVQVFTNPLWTFLIAGVAAITGEFYYTAMAVSFVLCLTTLAVIWRWLGRAVDGWLAVALLVSSKSFMDYSFVGSRISTHLSTSRDVHRPRARQARLPAGVPSETARARARRIPGSREPRRHGAAVCTGADLAPGRPGWSHWLARSGMARSGSRARVGMADLRDVLLRVPVPEYLLREGTKRHAALAATPPGIRVYGQQPPIRSDHPRDNRRGVWCGHGRGRSASPLAGCRGRRLRLLRDLGRRRLHGRTLFRGAIPRLHSPPRISAQTAGCGGRRDCADRRFNVVHPLVPLKSIPSLEMGWNWRLQNGVKDDRGATIGGASPLAFEIFRRMPDNEMAREARSLHASPERVLLVHPWIGEVGFYAGPTKYIIDPNGLSDPLMARLPIPPSFYFEFWVSHFTRELPAGYVESRREGRNLIEDPIIHDTSTSFYESRLVRCSHLPG